MPHLEEGAKILNCEAIPETVFLDKFSTISRSSVGGYLALGCFSFVSRAALGRYITIASRCSIGAFNHPIDWLSVCEFQYRDTMYLYGESLSSFSSKYSPSKKKVTHIGSDVWIGDNAVILQGVNIGNGAIIGASSVVTRDVDDFSIVVGNPAKHLRYRFDEGIREDLLGLKWWDCELSRLEAISFHDINLAISQLSDLGLPDNPDPKIEY